MHEGHSAKHTARLGVGASGAGGRAQSNVATQAERPLGLHFQVISSGGPAPARGCARPPASHPTSCYTCAWRCVPHTSRAGPACAGPLPGGLWWSLEACCARALHSSYGRSTQSTPRLPSAPTVAHWPVVVPLMRPAKLLMSASVSSSSTSGEKNVRIRRVASPLGGGALAARTSAGTSEGAS